MRVGHLGMTVKDTARTLDFYCNVLGAKLLWDAKVPQQGAQTDTIFGLEGAKVSVSGVNLHGITIEFFEFHTPKVPKDSYKTDYRTGGWKHLAFEVEDIDMEVRRLKDKGVHVRYPVQTLANGARMVYFDDPDGIMLELIQPRS
jgi:glyoxylase I family protein